MDDPRSASSAIWRLRWFSCTKSLTRRSRSSRRFRSSSSPALYAGSALARSACTNSSITPRIMDRNSVFSGFFSSINPPSATPVLLLQIDLPSDLVLDVLPYVAQKLKRQLLEHLFLQARRINPQVEKPFSVV